MTNTRINRIKSPDDMCFYGTVNLIADVLRDANVSYKNALISIMNLKDKYLAVKDKVIAWENYESLRIFYNDVRYSGSRRYMNWEEREMVFEFKQLSKNPPVKPKPREIELFHEYKNALLEKKSIEMFYNSPRYIKYTLGEGIEGKRLIEILREEVNFVEQENEYVLL